MGHTRFIDKTLLSITRLAEQSLFSEVSAQRRGLLQSLDVRTKLFTLLFLLVVVSLLRTPLAIWLMYGFSLVLAVLSLLSLRFFLKRVWLFVPLFSAAIVLPALLNVITPGDSIWVILRLDGPHTWGPYSIPAEIAITRQGLRGGIVFISRVAASVSFAVLFTLTSKWSDIFAGLRSLFVPRIFVMTLSLTYRYLFVFLRQIQDMYRGRKSRTIRSISAAADRNWTASRIGVSFKRSVRMSEDIYHAMISRGFQGEFPVSRRFRARARDYAWLVTNCGFGVIIVLLERSLL